MAVKRSVSFLILTVIYIAAAVLGVWVYLALPCEPWLKLLAADTAATVFTFVFSLIFRNASVYDPYWSVQPVVILWCFAGGSMTVPKMLLLTAVTLWGVRLTANWAYTFHGLGHQDWRYTMLKEKTGIFYPVINFVGIHMVPTLVVYGCTLPGLYLMQSDAPATLLTCLAFAAAVSAVLLQGSADCQMHAFRRKGGGGFIRAGLWRYSRHPNYLGEILMWWSVAVLCMSVLGLRWYFAAGAAANTLLFLCVSIPLADGRQSRKPDFSEYKKATRMLLPVKKRV